VAFFLAKAKLAVI